MGDKTQRWATAGGIALRAKSNLEVALAYAGHGIAVAPAKPTPNDVPYCGIEKDFKAPLIAPGDVTCDQAEIRRWWDKWPEALVWGRMGAGARIFSLDLDASPPHAHDGIGAWRALEAKHGAVETRAHLTPNKGEHLLFAWDPERPIKGSRGHLPEGIDVIGEGKGIILPGSILPDGQRWTIRTGIEPRPAPQWVFDMLLSGRGGARKGAGRKRGARPRPWPAGYGERRLEEALGAIGSAAPGTRDETAKLALNIGSLAAGGALDEQVARERLREAANGCAGSSYADKVVRHFDHGMKSPSEPPRQDERGFLLTKEGGLRACKANIVTALQGEGFKDVFRYDRLANVALVANPYPSVREIDLGTLPRPVKDTDVTWIQCYLSDHLDLIVDKDNLVASAVDAVAEQNSFHPFQDYLDSLTWDRKPRLDYLFIDYFGAKNDNQQEAILAARFFMIGLVARGYRPGCKMDYAVVLEGPQGIAKTRRSCCLIFRSHRLTIVGLIHKRR